MRKITELFFCDVCKKESHYCETIIAGIKPREGLSSASNSVRLIKEWEVCEECFKKGRITISLAWKITVDDCVVGKNVLVDHAITGQIKP